ncbi:hypothetical protein R1flu_000588 [Riccia fluitans]|uniref:MATH domain-containing protein n=1 Tax=Riccia fluitans TaxID=41844 RepID=A0ABD1Y0V3_9MARC
MVSTELSATVLQDKTGSTEEIDLGKRKRVTFRIEEGSKPSKSESGKISSMELQDGWGEGEGSGGRGDYEEEEEETTCATSEARFEIVTGSHQFTVNGYSLAKGIGAGKYIASDTFKVAGQQWAIYFYPDGKNKDDELQYISCFVARLSDHGGDVRALFELTLLDQTESKKHRVHSHFDRKLDHGPYNLKYRGSMWGYNHFYRRAALERSDYLKDDKLSFHCKVGVVVSSSPIGPSFSSLSQEQEPSTHISRSSKHRTRRSSSGESTDGSSESSGVENVQQQELSTVNPLHLLELEEMFVELYNLSTLVHLLLRKDKFTGETRDRKTDLGTSKDRLGDVRTGKQNITGNP